MFSRVPTDFNPDSTYINYPVIPQGCRMTNCTLEFVSIHALLAECDHQPGWGNDDGTCFNPRTPCGVRQSLGLGAVDHGLFQSTHSLRSATQVTYVGGNWDQVSIHALLAECDQDWHVPPPQISGFNPRTPCGVRRPVRFPA